MIPKISSATYKSPSFGKLIKPEPKVDEYLSRITNSNFNAIYNEAEKRQCSNKTQDIKFVLENIGGSGEDLGIMVTSKKGKLVFFCPTTTPIKDVPERLLMTAQKSLNKII